MNRGSSPLTRGKLGFTAAIRASPRLIPAHAGKTSQDPRSGRTSTAHPRSRGENPAPEVAAAVAQGSSPLTRGKRLAVAVGAARCRLIPAHAGKTKDYKTGVLPATAHPRSRGENDAPKRLVTQSCGSSPLTRGKPLVDGYGLATTGLIPAHAGKTWRGG